MKSKYHAKKVNVNGIWFASTKEGNRYKELLLLERAGHISDLRIQVPYELIPAQYETVHVFTPKTHKQKTVKKLVERKVVYVCDFQYTKDGETIVEDAKGMRTKEYIIKRKLMLYVHGVRIQEV